MYHKAQILALSCLTLISGSTATPVVLSSPTPLTLPTSKVNCNDVTTGLDPTCWAKLNMTGWMTHWSSTTPGAASIEVPSTNNPANPCGNPFDSSVHIASDDFGFNFSHCPHVSDTGIQGRAAAAAPAGCQEGELWSTCFLRLGLGKSGQDCSVMGKNSCDAPVAGQPPHTPQIFYGVWNIYAVNAYFYALDNAFEILIRNTTHQSIFRDALTKHANGTAIDLSPNKSHSVDSALIRILRGRNDTSSTNTPLIQYLQTYTSNSEYTYKSSVDEVWNGMYYIMHDALTDLMSDLQRFVVFVGEGAFSTGELPGEGELMRALEGE